MISLARGERYEYAQNLICISQLALRWPYFSVLKIPYQVCKGKLPIYAWHEELCMRDTDNVHHICQIDIKDNSIDLVQYMPNIVFLIQDVENIEKENPHYRAMKYSDEDITNITFTTENNISTIIPIIIRMKGYMFCLPLGENERSLDDDMKRLLDIMLQKNNIENLDSDKIYPFFIKKHENHKPLTTLELAQEFLKRLPPKTRCDQLLALLEIDKRFPGLSQDQIAILFPPPKGAEQAESFTKHGYRMRKEAQKYQKVLF